MESRHEQLRHCPSPHKAQMTLGEKIHRNEKQHCCLCLHVPYVSAPPGLSMGKITLDSYCFLNLAAAVAKSLQLCPTLRPFGLYVACQIPWSMGFLRQEYCLLYGRENQSQSCEVACPKSHHATFILQIFIESVLCVRLFARSWGTQAKQGMFSITQRLTK